MAPKKESLHAKSFHTTNPDSYEAGIETSQALAGIEPEVIILFMSIFYDFKEMLTGLYDGLGKRDVIVFGGTSDGFYESTGAANSGISALAINSQRRVQWRVAIRSGDTLDSFHRAKECMQELIGEMKGEDNLAMILADLKNDGVMLVKGVREVYSGIFIGGLTGDDWNFKQGFVLVNDQIYQNAVAILAMSGNFSYVINTASGWKPLGEYGNVDESEGNILYHIDGQTAFNFMGEQQGLPPAEVSLGLIPIAVYDKRNSENFFLRTPVKIDIDSGKITYFGSIAKGSWVRVCTATEEDVAEGVNQALAGIGTLKFTPVCAIVISCGARKWILKERVFEEVSRVFDVLGYSLPLIGFPSFGEIGPFLKPDSQYTDVYFHNVSYVVLIMGE